MPANFAQASPHAQAANSLKEMVPTAGRREAAGTVGSLGGAELVRRRRVQRQVKRRIFDFAAADAQSVVDQL